MREVGHRVPKIGGELFREDSYCSSSDLSVACCLTDKAMDAGVRPNVYEHQDRFVEERFEGMSAIHLLVERCFSRILESTLRTNER